MSFVVGVLGGIFAGLLGVGGGVILIPLMVELLKSGKSRPMEPA